MDKVYIIVEEKGDYHKFYETVMCFSSQEKANKAICEVRKKYPTKVFDIEVHMIDPI